MEIYGAVLAASVFPIIMVTLFLIGQKITEKYGIFFLRSLSNFIHIITGK